MPRVKHAVSSRRRRKKILKQAKGQWGGRSRLYRTAKESVQRALIYSTRDRKVKKRFFRSLWIVRINAGARREGITYNRLISGLKKANVAIDRKIMADLVIDDPRAFSELVKLAKNTN